MKKLVCLLLAAVLALIMMSAALAGVEASYKDGKVTVSTDEEGFWEITIDDEWIGHWIGSGHPSYTYAMELEDGEHVAIITNGGQRRSVTFWVGEPQPGGAQDTAAPETHETPAPAAPQGPVKLDSAAYATGVVRFQVSGLRGYAEIWLDGVNTGLTVNENGEQCIVKLLSEGEHTLALYVPAYDEVDTASFSAAEFSPKAEVLREILSTLIKNEAGELLGCGLSIDRNETSYLLRVSVDNKADAILTIGKEQLQALLDQGLNLIEYVNGKASLHIDLTKIDDAWFDTEEPIIAYCFVLIPDEAETQVTVYAETEEEYVEAGAFTGVTLIRDGKRTVVKQNGAY